MAGTRFSGFGAPFEGTPSKPRPWSIPGFTGYLALPPEGLGIDIGLPDSRSDWEVADGRRVDAPLYFATLEIVGLPAFPAMIIALGTAWILGRGAIDRYRVTFDRGQRVIVQP